MDERLPGRCGRPGVRAGMALAAGLALSDLSSDDLRHRCAALGADLTCRQLEAYLRGQSALSAHAHNIAALALNDHFADRGLGAVVAYSYDL